VRSNIPPQDDLFPAGRHPRRHSITWSARDAVCPAAPNSFRYGRSTVSIFSFANGALGEHRRHDTDGIRLEIDARRDQKWKRITLASSKTRGMNW
jgi:hypothetical protein